MVAMTRITVNSENKRELFQTIGPLLTQLRKAEGCLSTRLYLEIGNDNNCLLIEEWASQADWDNHMRSEGLAILRGAIQVLSNPLEVDFKLLMQTPDMEYIPAQ